MSVANPWQTEFYIGGSHTCVRVRDLKAALTDNAAPLSTGATDIYIESFFVIPYHPNETLHVDPVPRLESSIAVFAARSSRLS